MDIAKKIVTKLPLEELWNEKGMLHARRVSSCLNAADVIDMIKAGATFVIADVGQPPRWIDSAHRFDFWQTEVKPRLADVEQHAFLERYPGGYFYFASKWQLSDGLPLIVIERHH